jgi:hypothetical protein
MLSTNQLRELPGELLALTNLNMLFLAENRLRCIEGLEKLRNLKTLNLDSNEVWAWFIIVDLKQCEWLALPHLFIPKLLAKLSVSWTCLE